MPLLPRTNETPVAAVPSLQTNGGTESVIIPEFQLLSVIGTAPAKNAGLLFVASAGRTKVGPKSRSNDFALAVVNVIPEQIINIKVVRVRILVFIKLYCCVRVVRSFYANINRHAKRDGQSTETIDVLITTK